MLKKGLPKVLVPMCKFLRGNFFRIFNQLPIIVGFKIAKNRIWDVEIFWRKFFTFLVQIPFHHADSFPFCRLKTSLEC